MKSMQTLKVKGSSHLPMWSTQATPDSLRPLQSGKSGGKDTSCVVQRRNQDGWGMDLSSIGAYWFLPLFPNLSPDFLRFMSPTLYSAQPQILLAQNCSTGSEYVPLMCDEDCHWNSDILVD